MRSVAVILIIFGSLPYILIQPWIGVLVFDWISYMNPHRYAWGFIRHSPVAMIVAIATLIGLVLTKDKNRIPKDISIILMVLLWLVFFFTTCFAMSQRDAWPQLEQVSKIFFMIFISVVLINDAKKLRYLLLVMALSLGLIGIKGAIWVMLSGGANRVYGPEGTFIGDNNDLALALNMALPLLLYLSKGEPRKWLKSLLMASFAMSIVSIIFTYSRGGFVALALVSFLLLIKAKYKSLAVIVLGVGCLLALWVIPDQWSNRMNTIQTYEQDGSAMGRINAWKMAWNLALDRPFTGGGFQAFTFSNFRTYAPEPDNVHDAHSNYFEMLGEQGFIGLGLYLALIASCIIRLRFFKSRIRRNPDLQWAQHYPDMLQVSMIAYVVGGTFLGRAYFDMFYQLVGAMVILKRLVEPVTVSSSKVAAQERVSPWPRPVYQPQIGGARREST
jgi:probable O-glycosylation ligase (exosortase A-associated)